MFSESELRARLASEDPDEAETALRTHFRPIAAGPMTYDWCPLPGHVHTDDGDEPGPLVASLIRLANATERRLRKRRFEWRSRRHPDWPIVVFEGDSWVAHPFLCDITDHISDEDRYEVNVLSLGTGGHRLVDMEREDEFVEALHDHGEQTRAFLLSGGGNDLHQYFAEFLRPDAARYAVPDRVTDRLEDHMMQAMCTIQRMMQRAHRVAPSVRLFVHGYDYMQVERYGRGRLLGHHFDQAGLVSSEDRDATLRYIVDRFNALLATATRELPGVTYLDLRGVVPTDEWADEIHPNRRGFERLTRRVAAAML